MTATSAATPHSSWTIPVLGDEGRCVVVPLHETIRIAEDKYGYSVKKTSEKKLQYHREWYQKNREVLIERQRIRRKKLKKQRGGK